VRPPEEGELQSFLRVVSAAFEFSAIEMNLVPSRHLPVDGEIPKRTPASAVRVCNMVVGVIGDFHSHEYISSGFERYRWFIIPKHSFRK
jgi:hypothetical protein